VTGGAIFPISSHPIILLKPHDPQGRYLKRGAPGLGLRAPCHLGIAIMQATRLALALAAAAWAASVAPAQAPVATRQNVFSIPFQINQAGAPGEQPIEVQLYVSADQGKHWTLYARQHPTARKFDFQASRDGAYWFLVRTVDRMGRTHPAGPPQPELVVAVDTVAPKLTVNAVVGPSGEIIARWKANDEQLAPETFRLSYQPGPGKPWQGVAVAPPREGTPQTSISGETMWWTKAAPSQIQVRAEIRDRAGNPAVVNRTLDLAGTDKQSPTGGSPAAAPSSDLADGGQPGGDYSYPRTGRQDPPRPKPHDRDAAPKRNGAGTDRTGSTPPGSGAFVPWPADKTAAAPLGHGDDSSAKASKHPAHAGPYKPIHGPVKPPVRDEVAPGKPRKKVARGGNVLPPGERARMTNRQRFQLEYDVESVGPSGVAKVELWMTRDGGRTWSSAGVDSDRQSPFLVEAPGDGVYGYRIVIEAGNGLAGRPPRSGDMAEVWVGVDTTKPAGRITSAIYGKGDRAGDLTIHWAASDRQLADRPVTLSFSPAPGGPWSTIASGLPNSGRYVWRLGNRAPRDIYLRLEVKDEAGNTAVYELQEPIANDGLVPRGRIRGILPPDDERTGAYRMRTYQ